jgi:hypothetical protein
MVSVVVTVVVGCSVVLDDNGGRIVCEVRKSATAMEEGVWELNEGFSGVVSGVTVPCKVVISLDGVVFIVTAPLYIEVLSNVATKMAVLMKYKMAGMYCIIFVFWLPVIYVG